MSRREKGHSHFVVVFCPAFERATFRKIKGATPPRQRAYVHTTPGELQDSMFNKTLEKTGSYFTTSVEYLRNSSAVSVVSNVPFLKICVRS